MTAHEASLLQAIQDALDSNAHCVPGLLFRDRVVATQHGELSHEHDRERDYTPTWAQGPEDVFAVRATFPEACAALAVMIQRFEQDLRDSRSVVEGLEKWDGEYGSEKMVETIVEPPGRLDLRSFDVYGLDLKKDYNGMFSPSPHYDFSPGRKP